MPRNRAAGAGGGGGKWLTTFNDMMTLLLTFFVLLLSMGSLEGGKTRKLYTEFRAALGVLGMGKSHEYEVVKPIVPILKIGEREKIVKNVYRIREDEKGSPGEDALRQREERRNIVVRSVPEETALPVSHRDAAMDGESEAPLLPQEMIQREALRMGAAELEKEDSGVTYEIRDQYTVAISVPQLFLFDPGQAEVKPSARRILKRVAEFLTRHPDLNVVVEGHTDGASIQTERFPSKWELSVARAAAVVRVLLAESELAPERFGVTGLADSRPMTPGEDAADLPENRRVEILLTYTF